MLDSLHILVNLLDAAVECWAAEELQRLRQLRSQRMSHRSSLARGGVVVMVVTYRLNESPLSNCQFDVWGVVDGETLPQFPSESAIEEVPLLFLYPILIFECR
jgi:hypothetical protein